MFCIKCGEKQVNQNAKFCTKCGSSRENEQKNIDNDSITNRQRKNIEQNQATMQEITNEKKSLLKNIILIILVLVVLPIFLIVGYILLQEDVIDITDHEILGTWHLVGNPNYIYTFSIEDQSSRRNRGIHTNYKKNIGNTPERNRNIFWHIYSNGSLRIYYDPRRLEHSRPLECTQSGMYTNATGCLYNFTIEGNRLILENRHRNIDDIRVFERVN